MPKKFVFAVQGEGRGHLTQAIAMFRMLQEQGHTVSCVIVGKNPNRELPEFFLKKITVPIIQVESPNFSMGSSGRSVHMGKTILKNLLNWRGFAKSLRMIQSVVETFSPDVLVNFYEPLIPLYVLRYPRNFRIISVAHQYSYLHEHYQFPHGSALRSRMLKWYTAFTALGSEKIMALSMYDMPRTLRSKLCVTPPLLRSEVYNRPTSEEDFILVYLVNSGFMKDIIDWHRKNPKMRLEVFTDNSDVKDRHKGWYRFDDTLSFHSLSDEKFLDMMARCSTLVCTAGFESVCEAMYLGKPIVMVPVPGHYEQYCNARDAHRIGAGTHARHFNLDILHERLITPYASNAYKNWVNSFDRHLRRVIAQLESPRTTPRTTTRPISPSIP